MPGRRIRCNKPFLRRKYPPFYVASLYCFAETAFYPGASGCRFVAYAKFNAPDGSDYDNAQVMMMAGTDQTFILPKGYKLQVSGSYSSPMALGVATYKARYNMSLGGSKTLLQGKGTVTLNVSDPFNWFNSRFDVSSFGVVSANYMKPETRFVRATFTYRFGNKNVKAAANRKNAIDSESRRMQYAISFIASRSVDRPEPRSGPWVEEMIYLLRAYCFEREQ